MGVFSVIWPSTFLFLRGRKVWYGWVPHVDDITHKIEQNVGTHKNGKNYTEKIEDFCLYISDQNSGVKYGNKILDNIYDSFILDVSS